MCEMRKITTNKERIKQTEQDSNHSLSEIWFNQPEMVLSLKSNKKP